MFFRYVKKHTPNRLLQPTPTESEIKIRTCGHTKKCNFETSQRTAYCPGGTNKLLEDPASENEPTRTRLVRATNLARKLPSHQPLRPSPHHSLPLRLPWAAALTTGPANTSNEGLDHPRSHESTDKALVAACDRDLEHAHSPEGTEQTPIEICN